MVSFGGEQIKNVINQQKARIDAEREMQRQARISREDQMIAEVQGRMASQQTANEDSYQQYKAKMDSSMGVSQNANTSTMPDPRIDNNSMTGLNNPQQQFAQPFPFNPQYSQQYMPQSPYLTQSQYGQNRSLYNQGIGNNINPMTGGVAANPWR